MVELDDESVKIVMGSQNNNSNNSLNLQNNINNGDTEMLDI